MAEVKKSVPSSPFMGRSDGVVFEGQTFPDPITDCIVDYKELPSVRKTGEGQHDFVVIKEIVPSSKTNRADYINSFTSDVGIMNILKKVLVGGETIDDVVKSGKFKSNQKGLVDLSQLPDNIVDAYKAVEKGVNEFDKLPESARKKQSFAAFAESFGQDEFNKYIQAEVRKVIELQKKEKKDGE